MNAPGVSATGDPRFRKSHGRSGSVSCSAALRGFVSLLPMPQGSLRIPLTSPGAPHRGRTQGTSSVGICQAELSRAVFLSSA